MVLGKTITTYLMDGDPQGIKSIFISNRICQCVAIPRGLLKTAKQREELQQPSLYLLFGETSQGEPLVYIGETENFHERIKDHNYQKDFWNEALAFVAKDNSLSKADVKLLEYLALEQTQQVKLFKLEENKNTPSKPHLPEHQRDSVMEFFQDVQVLASFLGYRLFENQPTQAQHLFYCKNKQGTDAKGMYEGKTFRVLAQSCLRKQAVPSFDQGKLRREQLLENAARETEAYYELAHDLVFQSPSAASSFCLGANSNGWDEWKNKNGKTLNQIIRTKDNN